MRKFKSLTISVAFALYSNCITSSSAVAADNIQENFNPKNTGFSFQNISSYFTSDLYQIWSGEDSEFDEIEKEHIFQEYLKRNDPMAKLVECEKLLAQKLTSSSSAKLVSVELWV